MTKLSGKMTCGRIASMASDATFGSLFKKFRLRAEFSNLSEFGKALAEIGIDESTYFDEKSADKPLPWHHIHINDIRLDSLIKAWNVFKDKRGLFVLD